MGPLRLLLSKEELPEGVERRARRVTACCGSRPLTTVGVLTGVGFDLPDEFVVGDGLDYHDAYRNLSYVAVWEPGDMSGDPA